MTPACLALLVAGIGQEQRDPVADRDNRDGDDGTGNAEEQGAAGDCHQDDEGMQADGSPHDQRLEEVALDLLRGQDYDEHDHSIAAAIGDQGHEDGGPHRPSR